MSSYPLETGWYHHVNGAGGEEVVYVCFAHGSFWVKKISGAEYPIEKDKGKFGERILMPSEEE